MIALLFSFALASAQTSDAMVTGFKWTASGTLDLSVSKNGQAISFPRTSLREAAGETATVDGGGLHAIVTTYPGFVAVIFGKVGGEGDLILLERKNAAFEVISDPIPGRLGEMPDSLKYIISEFAKKQKIKPDDVSMCFRAIVAYMDANPRKQLNDVASEVERGTDLVMLVQKPPTKVADQPAAQATGPAPAPAARPTPPPQQQRPRVVAQPRPRPANPYYQQQDPYGYPPQRQARRPQPGIENFFGMFD